MWSDLQKLLRKQTDPCNSGAMTRLQCVDMLAMGHAGKAGRFSPIARKAGNHATAGDGSDLIESPGQIMPKIVTQGKKTA